MVDIVSCVVFLPEFTTDHLVRMFFTITGAALLMTHRTTVITRAIREQQFRVSFTRKATFLDCLKVTFPSLCLIKCWVVAKFTNSKFDHGI